MNNLFPHHITINMLLLLIGLVSTYMGNRLFKIASILMGAVLAFLIGYMYGWIYAILFTFIGMIVGFVLPILVVSLGLYHLLFILNNTTFQVEFPFLNEYAGIVLFMISLIITLLLFDYIIIFFFALTGSYLITISLFKILSYFNLVSSFNPLLILVLILVFFLTGFITQLFQSQQQTVRAKQARWLGDNR